MSVNLNQYRGTVGTFNNCNYYYKSTLSLGRPCQNTFFLNCVFPFCNISLLFILLISVFLTYQNVPQITWWKIVAIPFFLFHQFFLYDPAKKAWLFEKFTFELEASDSFKITCSLVRQVIHGIIGVQTSLPRKSLSPP